MKHTMEITQACPLSVFPQLIERLSNPRDEAVNPHIRESTVLQGFLEHVSLVIGV